MPEALWVGEDVNGKVVLGGAYELQVQLFEGPDAPKQGLVLRYPVHGEVADSGSEEDVHRTVLRVLLVGIVLEEAVETVLALGQQVDRVDLVKLLAHEAELLDGRDAVVDQLHHLHKAAEDAQREVVRDQYERHGLRLHTKALEHLAELAPTRLLECFHGSCNSDN